MCEACRDPKVDWEETSRLTAQDEEWSCDGEDGLCSRRAVWVTRFSLVDEHLCDAHKEEAIEDEEPGLREILDATGLKEGSYVLAIRASEPCEGPLMGPSCGKRATWAHVMIAQTYSCEKHRPKSAAGARKAAS